MMVFTVFVHMSSSVLKICVPKIKWTACIVWIIQI